MVNISVGDPFSTNLNFWVSFAHNTKIKQVSAIKKLNTSWHENILCIFGCVGLESVLTKHFLEDAELEFNFIDIKHFDGPKWTNLPGPYIRSQLAEINELYVEEGQQLLKWTEKEHTLMELSKFDAYHIVYILLNPYYIYIHFKFNYAVRYFTITLKLTKLPTKV